MSYQTSDTRKSGTVEAEGDSSADPLQWDATNEAGRAVMVLTVTTSVAMTLHIRQAATVAELDAPHLDLPHEWTESISANATERIVVPLDPALPCGRAWLATTDEGDYVLDGGRRAHS